MSKSASLITIKTISSELDVISGILMALGSFVPDGCADGKMVVFLAELISDRLGMLDNAVEGL